MLLRYFFGEDVFISYTRADAITYAAGLANELTRRDFSCFLDQWGTPPGRELPKPLRRALGRSMAFVLVGSDGATRSAAVEKELREFLRTRRIIIPISFEGALPRAPWYDLIAGLALSAEHPDALRTGNPSPTVISRIEKSFQYARRNQRARRTFAVASVLLVGLAAASGYFSHVAREEANNAKRQEENARKSAEAAKTQEDIARKKAEEAAEKAAEARKQAERANEQQQLSESRALAANAVAQLPIDPEASLILAMDGWRKRPTGEAIEALRLALRDSLMRIAVTDSPARVTPGAFSPDGRFAVLATGKSATVFDLASGQEVAKLPADGKALTSASFDPTDGQVVLTADEHQIARIWHWREQKVIAELRGHIGPNFTARFDSTGRYVLTATGTPCEGSLALARESVSEVRAWDSRSGRPTGSVWRGACGRYTRIDSFTPDGDFIVYACAGSEKDPCDRSRFWEVSAGKPLSVPEQLQFIDAAAFSTPAGIAAGRVRSRRFAPDSEVHVWNIRTGASVASLSEHGEHMAFDRMGRFLATSSGRSAFVWQVAGDARKAGGKLEPTVTLAGHDGRVNSVAFSADGRYVLTSSDDRTARVWDVTTGQIAATLRGHAAAVTGAAFSPDGRHIVTSAADRTSRIWSAGAGQGAVELAWPQEDVQAARFTPEGRIVSRAGRNRVRIWSDGRDQLFPEVNGEIQAISDDGSLALTADADPVAHIYRFKNRRSDALLTGHHAWINVAAYSPDGAVVVTGGEDRKLHIWSATDGSLQRELEVHSDSVTGLDFSSEGSRFATAIRNGTVMVWDRATGTSILSQERSGTGVRLSPDGKLLLAFERVRPASLWAVEGNRRLAQLEDPAGKRGHREQVRAASFNSQGDLLVTADVYWPIVWKLSGWSGTQPLEAIVLNTSAGNPVPGPVSHVTFGPDGRTVLASYRSGHARIWDAHTGRMLQEWKHGAAVAAGAFNADGTLAATVGADGTVRTRDIRTGALWKVFRSDAPFLAHVVFSPDGAYVAAGSDTDADVSFVWSTRTGELVARVRGHSPAFSPSSDRLLTISRSHKAKVWNAAAGRLLAELAGFTGVVTHAAYSSNRKRLLMVTSDLSVRILDAETGKLLATHRGHKARINSAVFSPDGSHVVTASDDRTVFAWRWAAGKIDSLKAGVRRAIAGDRQILAFALGPEAHLWNFDSEAGPVQLPGITGTFSRDGARAATATEDHAIRIWDTRTEQLIAELRGHTGKVSSVAFSPDGRHLVSASEDRTAMLWDMSTRSAVMGLFGAKGGLSSAAFSPLGDAILVKGETLRLYECAVCGSGDQLMKRAESRLRRSRD